MVPGNSARNKYLPIIHLLKKEVAERIDFGRGLRNKLIILPGLYVVMVFRQKRITHGSTTESCIECFAWPARVYCPSHQNRLLQHLFSSIYLSSDCFRLAPSLIHPGALATRIAEFCYHVLRRQQHAINKNPSACATQLTAAYVVQQLASFIPDTPTGKTFKPSVSWSCDGAVVVAVNKTIPISRFSLQYTATPHGLPGHDLANSVCTIGVKRISYTHPNGGADRSSVRSLPIRAFFSRSNAGRCRCRQTPVPGHYPRSFLERLGEVPSLQLRLALLRGGDETNPPYDYQDLPETCNRSRLAGWCVCVLRCRQEKRKETQIQISFGSYSRKSV